MSRPRLILVAVGTAILAGAGTVPWSIAGGGAADRLDRALSRAYGVRFAARGGATLSLLPAPRLTFRDASLRSVAGAELVAAPTMVAQLSLSGLLLGEADPTEIRLEEARVVVADRAGDPRWDEVVARVRARLAEGHATTLRRVTMRGASASLAGAGLAGGALAGTGLAGAADPGGREASETLDALDLTATWPRWGAEAGFEAAARWRGVPVRLKLAGLRPAEWAAGRSTPLTLDAEWPFGKFSVRGQGVLAQASSARISPAQASPVQASPAQAASAQAASAQAASAQAASARAPSARDGAEPAPRPAPDLAGRASLETASLRRLLDWTGAPLALAPLVEAFALDCAFEWRGREVVLPQVRAVLGGKPLDGAGSVSLVGPRPGPPAGGRIAVTATLDAGDLDVNPLLAAALDPEAASRPLASLTAGDLDLRLSTASASIGPLRLVDAASTLVVQDGRIEAAIGRATLHGGALKGRLALGVAPRDAMEAKVQAAFEDVDLGALLAAFGHARWMRGAAAGQVALEATGATPFDLVRRLGGRVALTVADGEILGLDLHDAARGTEAPRAPTRLLQVERRPLGRTTFERAQVALALDGGRAEITEAVLAGPALQAGLRGHLSLAERTLDALAEVETRAEARPGSGAGAAGPAAAHGARYAITGPWDGPTVRALRPGDPPAGPRLPPAASAFAQ